MINSYRYTALAASSLIAYQLVLNSILGDWSLGSLLAILVLVALTMTIYDEYLYLVRLLMLYALVLSIVGIYWDVGGLNNFLLAVAFYLSSITILNKKILGILEVEQNRIDEAVSKELFETNIDPNVWDEALIESDFDRERAMVLYQKN